MIYIPELWEKQPGEAACADKISKTGGNMIGPLDMGNNKISALSDPINNMDVANKQYVDSKKPVISVWAASNGNINNNAYEWNFGEKGRRGSDSPRSYPMLTNGRITHGAISLVYVPNANILDPDEQVVQIGLNTQEPDYKLSTTVKRFDTPLELVAGDIIMFKSIKNVSGVNYATVNVLIEIDI